MFSGIHISPTFWLIGILALIVLAVIVFSILPPIKEKAEYIYKTKEYVMSKPEQICFNVFKEVIGEKYYIFPQVHLSTFLDHKIVGQNWWGAFRHIDEKSVDFVLCDKQTFLSILAVELDEKSHEQPVRQDRDREVERILDDAKMPLLRIRNEDINDKNELLKKIEQQIHFYKNKEN
jgi:very-short-patch-repair endonuclease